MSTKFSKQLDTSFFKIYIKKKKYIAAWNQIIKIKASWSLIKRTLTNISILNLFKMIKIKSN